MTALLAQILFKSGLILGLAWVVTRLMQRRSAAARHLVWTVALLLAALLPPISRVLPAWTVRIPVPVAPALGGPVSTAAAVEVGAREPHENPAGRPNPALSPTLPTAGITTSPIRSEGIPLEVWTLLAWSLVASVLLIRILSDLGALARLIKSATPLAGAGWEDALDEATRSSGVGRRVRLLGSERTTVPMTWGVVRPVVLLPQGTADWSAERRRAVLLHELAHVARWDYATQLAARLCCALYWLNPLVWVAARALRSERERACDDRVLAAGARASSYAGELLELARSSLGGASPGVALAMARRSELEGRLLSILNPAIRREGPRARSAMLFAAAALAVALPLAAFRPAGPASAPEPRGAPNPPSTTPSATAPDTPRPPAPRPRGAAVRQAGPVAPRSAALCDQGGNPSHHSHSMTDWTDSGHRSWRVSWSGDECSVDLVAKGEVKFSADFSDVTSLDPDGYLEITVREKGKVTRVDIRPEGGTLRRSFTVNGNAAPYDAAARAWLAGFLVELDRHSAFAVDARFPALLRQGVPAVLDEIDRMATDYARRVYYRKLIGAAKLSSAEVRRVARTAGSTMDSDYELRQVLAALAEQYSLGDAEVRDAFIAAAGTLQSDYERSELLLVVIAKGAVTTETGRTIVKLAQAMSSDYEKARVLLALGDSRLVDRRSVAPEYLDVVAGMQSDYERGRVLKLVVGAGQLTKESVLRVLETVGRMESDYEAANVLVELAARNTLAGDLRDAYRKAADRLSSEYERQRARNALRDA